MADTDSSFSDKSSIESPDVSDDARKTPCPNGWDQNRGPAVSRDGGLPIASTAPARATPRPNPVAKYYPVPAHALSEISISSRDNSTSLTEPASEGPDGRIQHPVVNLPVSICWDWMRGRCFRETCCYQHIRPNEQAAITTPDVIHSVRPQEGKSQTQRESPGSSSDVIPVRSAHAGLLDAGGRTEFSIVQSLPLQLPRGYCFEWVRRKYCPRRSSCPFTHKMPPPNAPEVEKGTTSVPSLQVPCIPSPDQVADVQKSAEAPMSSNLTARLNRSTTISAVLHNIENKPTATIKPSVKITNRDASTVQSTPPVLNPQPPQPARFNARSTAQMKDTPVAKSKDQSTRPAKVDSPPTVPKHQPPQEQTIMVVDPIRVTFGPGFSVNKIVTASESLWITIANVPGDTNRGALERLLTPFGHVVDIRFPQSKHANETTITISAQMASYSEAVAAIEALDETTVFGSKISVRSSLGKTMEMQRVQDGDIRVSWAVPSRNGYAGFETLKAAQKAVTEADGSILRGHWVTATMYDGLPVIGQYNVRFHGLPHDALAKNIKKFGHSQDTMLERPNYSSPEFGIPAVEAILRDCGSMAYFEALPPPYKDGIVRAWCRFDSPDVARFACEKSGVKQRTLGGEKIWMHRVHSVKQAIDRKVHDAIRTEIVRLRTSLSQFSRGTTMTVIDKPEMLDSVSVKLVSEDSKTLAEIKARLTELTRGELVMEGGRQVWDDFFGHPFGQEFVNGLHASNPDVLVHVDRNRRTIRVIGEREKRKVVVASLLSKIAFRRSQRIHTVPLQGRLIGLFMSADLMQVQQKHGPENVWLDLMKRTLCVRGSEEVYEEVQHIVHRVKDRHPHEKSHGRCPVCFEDPTTPVTLSCGHTWCKACLAGYLTAAVDTRQFPLNCLGNEASCKECIPLYVARDVLSPSTFETLTRAAFDAYVHARPEEFHYCPTPDCPQVYRPGPRDSVYACPTCLCRICPHCHVEYHEGVTCADREDGFDRLFDQWASTHDVKKCPGCKAPIERAEGCNHMTCTRCHTHTCWVCLETFPKGQGIYDHMRQEHGSIGL
ncbi:hypothetical protein OF83DRAFT_1175779 [Amylostereum chailletii]|nr:hypothetical protein OF83DRAFT_1175779 [Amylostereum chailletii]